MGLQGNIHIWSTYGISAPRSSLHFDVRHLSVLNFIGSNNSRASGRGRQSQNETAFSLVFLLLHWKRHILSGSLHNGGRFKSSTAVMKHESRGKFWCTHPRASCIFQCSDWKVSGNHFLFSLSLSVSEAVQLCRLFTVAWRKVSPHRARFTQGE